MSERKVLNKYYPPDFDPSKIPKLKLPKDRQYVVRLMAPFNMRCKTCGEYIYKGKKFNARKETVQNEQYLGLPIFRFYIKCTRCLAEITFKTDPENTDYAMEHGATRNFQAEKLIEEEEKRFQKEREDEELNNPMKVLENRTKDSKMEMDILENLQELKELNQRQASVDFESMLGVYRETEEDMKRREEEEDERQIREMMAEAQKRRLVEDSDSEGEEALTGDVPERAGGGKPTDILTNVPYPNKKHCGDKSGDDGGKPKSRAMLLGLVRRKKGPETSANPEAKDPATETNRANGSQGPATETNRANGSQGPATETNRANGSQGPATETNRANGSQGPATETNRADGSQGPATETNRADGSQGPATETNRANGSQESEQANATDRREDRDKASLSSGNSANIQTVTTNPSSLSLLGAYSDSEESE
ncbi:splicing factor YJU2 [Dendropsophus ebraccatus]|uniref:splicing factor YJU2 n=1 Tax=Dendropsophus ebraccatus TaxID=150705 RepID=UPI003831E958